MEKKLNIAKRTLLTKLYAIEQETLIFKETFPNEYEGFKKRIEDLKKSYNYSLEEMKKILTFEVDPETDAYKIYKVEQLENDIKIFIKKEVKFDIISKHLQHLIKKLNILYNVSIFHYKKCEKDKALSQVYKAKELEIKLAEEFKSADYILADMRMRERIIELLSYVDYEILKLEIRNSGKHPGILISELVTLEEFEEFDYISTFISFIKDEINDIMELVNLISDEEKKKIFERKLSKILEEFTYFNKKENPILNSASWDEFLDFESSVLQLLKFNGIEEDKTRINIISKMCINVNDVITIPLTNAQIALVNLFYKTQDTRIFILEKLFENMPKSISYKEIYFLALLFDVTEVLENNSNELSNYIKQYKAKYPYDANTIMKRKKALMNSEKKDYLFAFVLDDSKKNDIIQTLKTLEIDFKISENKLFINSFYFNNLKNVNNSLLCNTKNVISSYECKNDYIKRLHN